MLRKPECRRRNCVHELLQRGGTTAAALHVLNERDFAAVVDAALDAACRRAAELEK